jgi:preprotein translocase subunit SecB
MGQFKIRIHYPTEIQYTALEESHPGGFLTEAAISVSGGPNTNDPLDWRVSVTVSFKAKDKEIEVAKGTVAFVGYFDLPPEVKEEDRNEFVNRNAAPILYAAIRELVANISARSPNGAVILAPMVFSDEAAEKPITKHKSAQKALKS